ncbi:MAG TPA: trypsin-like peptidase domain-containing protein [Vicinamibacterales bacterium]|jgi:S1-C subfamily serine protease
MERVILRHLSGSRAGQVEEFPLDGVRELAVGRDPTSSVRYDPDRDDLVGRHHAKIERDLSDPHRFTLVDLDSRNGTYLNKQRISGRVNLVSGDLVQFGPGGPELVFEIEPPPAHVPPVTRVPGVPDTAQAGPRDAGAVGRATVERMIKDANRRARASTLVVVGVLLVLLVIIGSFFAYRSVIGRTQLVDQLGQAKTALEEVQKTAPMSPVDIARLYTDATVFIEVGWKLIHTETGGQVYHEYHVDTDSRGRPVKDKDGDVVAIPIYIRLPDGKIEPSLSIEHGSFQQNQPIGGRHTGSGFVVAADGYILTNRHVAATWETAYTEFPDGGGVVVDLETKKTAKLAEAPRDWVPAAARVLGRRALTGKNVEGRHDYLDVTFARTRLRIPAKLVRVSDRHDASMIKVDVPQAVKKVVVFENPDIATGASLTIMGYPAISPSVAVVTRSQDPFNRESQTRSVPDPTVTPATVGRVLKGAVSPAGGGEYDYLSEFGDSYQLTANATGGGNSGGPVFDDRGRVIGIFYASRTTDARITFAVPIKYGLELMRVGPAVRQ